MEPGTCYLVLEYVGLEYLVLKYLRLEYLVLVMVYLGLENSGSLLTRMVARAVLGRCCCCSLTPDQQKVVYTLLVDLMITPHTKFLCFNIFL